MCRTEIKQEKSDFFTKFSIKSVDEKIGKENVSTIVYELLKQFIEEYNLDESRIYELKVDHIKKKNQVILNLEYFNFDSKELDGMILEDQIRFVLNKMGYSNEAIYSIEYKPKWGPSSMKVWVVELYDEDYAKSPIKNSNFTHTFEGNLMSTLKKVLGIMVYFEFV